MTTTITLIYTARQMNLTIDASGVAGPLEIARMGPDGNPIDKKPLSAGAKNPALNAAAGDMYKVNSEKVVVTADTTDPQALVVMAVETKDPPPDQPKGVIAIAAAMDKLHKFGVDAKKLQKLHAFVVDVRGGISISLPGPTAR